MERSVERAARDRRARSRGGRRNGDGQKPWYLRRPLLLAIASFMYRRLATSAASLPTDTTTDYRLPTTDYRLPTTHGARLGKQIRRSAAGCCQRAAHECAGADTGRGGPEGGARHAHARAHPSARRSSEACVPAHRAMLEQAIADLDQRLPPVRRCRRAQLPCEADPPSDPHQHGPCGLAASPARSPLHKLYLTLHMRPARRPRRDPS